jgi:hypothetical protein
VTQALQRNRVHNGQRRAESASRAAGRPNATRVVDRKADSPASFRTRPSSLHGRRKAENEGEQRRNGGKI